MLNRAAHFNDDTGRLALEIGRGRAGFQLVRGAPRPHDGWTGKNWALVQGAARARGDWLLLADADVTLHPAALKQAMADALARNVSALSILPALECETFPEKTLMPLFALLSALIEPMDAAGCPDSPAARLSGAFLLVRRSDYEAVGGHETVAGALIEDLALARVFKQRGLPLRLTWTHDLVRTRMYSSFSGLWGGLTRLSFPTMNYSTPRLLAAWLAILWGPLAPWMALAIGCLQSSWAVIAAALALCAWIPAILRPLLVLLRVPRRYAWLLQAAALFFGCAATASAWRHATGRGFAWKGRRYRQGRASNGLA